MLSLIGIGNNIFHYFGTSYSANQQLKSSNTGINDENSVRLIKKEGMLSGVLKSLCFKLINSFSNVNVVYKQ